MTVGVGLAADGRAAGGGRGANLQIRDARLSPLLAPVAVAVEPDAVAYDGLVGAGLQDEAKISIAPDLTVSQRQGAARIRQALRPAD